MAGEGFQTREKKNKHAKSSRAARVESGSTTREVHARSSWNGVNILTPRSKLTWGKLRNISQLPGSAFGAQYGTLFCDDGPLRLGEGKGTWLVQSCAKEGEYKLRRVESAKVEDSLFPFFVFFSSLFSFFFFSFLLGRRGGSGGRAACGQQGGRRGQGRQKGGGRLGLNTWS